MKLKIILMACLLASFSVNADENYFGYSYGSETLPAGGKELYQWITLREGKSAGDYQALDLKTEYEVGLSERWQASVYLNFSRFDIQGVSGFGDIDGAWNWNGTQVSFKYNWLSPYKDALGVAFYIEPGYARYQSASGQRQDEIELEPKLILQKNFLDDQLVAVFNLTPEVELEHETETNGEKEWEPELKLEATGGVSYRFIPNWFGGLEARYDSGYPKFEKREYYAYFAGPNLHYGGKDWWFTLTYLPQIYGEPNEDGRLHLAEHEEREYRLKLGYNF
jgi:hypothetical protein